MWYRDIERLFAANVFISIARCAGSAQRLTMNIRRVKILESITQVKLSSQSAVVKADDDHFSIFKRTIVGLSMQLLKGTRVIDTVIDSELPFVAASFSEYLI